MGHVIMESIVTRCLVLQSLICLSVLFKGSVAQLPIGNKGISYVYSRNLSKDLSSKFLYQLLAWHELADRQAVKDRRKLWPHGKIPFVINPNDFDSSQLKVIYQAMEDIQKQSCVRFVPRKDTFEIKNYIVIKKTGKGCLTDSIGMKGGAQVVSLDNSCLKSKVTPIHELMHIIGFYHEHSRHDRDDHVKIYKHNIQEDKLGNFKEVPSQLLGTSYDFKSIMHYKHYEFAKDRKQSTIERKCGSKDLSNQEGLTQIDIKRINRLYRCNEEDCWDDDLDKCARLLGTKGLSYCVTQEVLMSQMCKKTCGLCGNRSKLASIKQVLKHAAKRPSKGAQVL